MLYIRPVETPPTYFIVSISQLGENIGGQSYLLLQNKDI